MEESKGSLPEDIRTGLQAAAMGGVAKLKSFIMESNSAWKTVPINIAITGQSGAGKSSFINAIRGLTADDKGAAPVGSVETTKDITSYEHPSNENMILWDLPGVGTPNFTQNTYLDKVKFERFDFFIILSAGRFHENDILLAKEIHHLNKNFLFVRTHMRPEIEKDMEAHPYSHDTSKLLKQIRDDCLQHLADFGVTGSSVFLIDIHRRFKFDFNVLTTTLIEKVPEIKREAMALSMSLLTTGVLQKKYEVLSNRIFSASIFSAIGGVMPIPLLGSTVDEMILSGEVDLFKQQFGLEAETLKEYSCLLKTESSELENQLCLKSLALAGTAKGLVQQASCAITSMALEDELPVQIPLISCVVSAGFSYGVTKASLKYFLKLCYEDAMKINEELMRNALNKFDVDDNL